MICFCLIFRYTTFASGKFPLGIQSIKLKSENINLPKIDDKINELVEFENKLYRTTKQLKMLNKKQRKKMLLIDTLTTNKIKKPNKARRSLLTTTDKLKISLWHEDDIRIDNSFDTIRKRKTTDPNIDSSKKARKSNAFIETNSEVTPLKNKMVRKPCKADTNTQPNCTTNKVFIAKEDLYKVDDKWSIPLEDGEVEYFTPSPRKRLCNSLQDSELNSSQKKLVINPAALRGKNIKKQISNENTTPQLQEKKVKIMLKLNKSQDTNEYIRQLRSSPNLPYDSTKKPIKGLLKPNLLPSPINPYYKKKLGL